MNTTDLNFIVFFFFPLFSFYLDFKFCHFVSLSHCLLPEPGKKVLTIKKLTVCGSPEGKNPGV